MAPRGTRSWASSPALRSSFGCRRTTPCSTCALAEWSSPPDRPSSTQSSRAIGSRACTPAGLPPSWPRPASTFRGRWWSGSRSPGWRPRTSRDALLRIEGEGRVSAVVTGADGEERRTACQTLILNLGRAPRDVLARMSDDAVTVVGSAAEDFPLPPSPTAGIVCPCVGTTVEDLEGAWARGFHEVELLKRATLCGTGTCQGGACLPHLRAFVAARTGTVPAPFTARPGVAADHPRRGGGRRSSRCLPAHCPP